MQSDSIGKLLGYIAIPIEEGMRPPIEWRVTFSNVNGRSFTLEPLWPAENDPVEQILSASVEIDPKLVRAQSEPDFFKHENGKRHRLSLEATLGGRPTRAISLKKQIEMTRSGKKSSETIYDVVSRVFTFRYDENANQLVTLKEGAPMPNRPPWVDGE